MHEDFLLTSINFGNRTSRCSLTLSGDARASSPLGGLEKIVIREGKGEGNKKKKQGKNIYKKSSRQGRQEGRKRKKTTIGDEIEEMMGKRSEGTQRGFFFS